MKKLLLVLVCAFLIGCGTNLSRNKAKEVIREHFKFPHLECEVIPIGSNVPLSMNSMFAHCDYSYNLNPGWLKGLANAGFINFRILRKYGYNSYDASISLTDEGKKYVFGNPEKCEKHQIVKLMMAYKDLDKVTGIKMLEGNKKADVEYTWHYVNQTPIGKTAINYNESGSNNVQASLTLYDDGWRY